MNSVNCGNVQSFGASGLYKISANNAREVGDKVRKVRNWSLDQKTPWTVDITSPEFNGTLKFLKGKLRQATSNGITRTYDSTGKLNTLA